MSSQVYRLDTTSKSLSLLNSKLMSDLGYYEVGRTTAKAHVPVKIIQRRIGAPSAAGDAAGRSDDKAMALMSKCVFPSGTRSTTVSHRVGGRSKPNNHVPPPHGRAFRPRHTTSLRGLYNQQIHGSKRSLRSVEDFSEFEQRTAYFNGDHVSATRKG